MIFCKHDIKRDILKQKTKLIFQRYLTAIRTYFTRWLIRTNSYEWGRTNSYELVLISMNYHAFVRFV